MACCSTEGSCDTFTSNEGILSKCLKACLTEDIYGLLVTFSLCHADCDLSVSLWFSAFCLDVLFNSVLLCLCVVTLRASPNNLQWLLDLATDVVRPKGRHPDSQDQHS